MQRTEVTMLSGKSVDESMIDVLFGLLLSLIDSDYHAYWQEQILYPIMHRCSLLPYRTYMIQLHNCHWN